MALRPNEEVYFCPHVTTLRDSAKGEVQIKANQVIDETQQNREGCLFESAPSATDGRLDHS